MSRRIWGRVGMGQEKPERAGRGQNSVGIQLQLPGHFHPVAATGIPQEVTELVWLDQQAPGIFYSQGILSPWMGIKDLGSRIQLGFGPFQLFQMCCPNIPWIIFPVVSWSWWPWSDLCIRIRPFPNPYPNFPIPIQIFPDLYPAFPSCIQPSQSISDLSQIHTQPFPSLSSPSQSISSLSHPYPTFPIHIRPFPSLSSLSQIHGDNLDLSHWAGNHFQR